MGRKWACVKVPEEVKKEVMEIKQIQEKAAWQIVAEAVSFYRAMISKREHFSQSADVDKLAYYVMKLIKSATYYQLEASKESLEKFLRVAEQLEKRMGISCQELRPAAERLIRKRDGKSIHTFNMALKGCIIKLILKLMEAPAQGEEKKGEKEIEKGIEAA